MIFLLIFLSVVNEEGALFWHHLWERLEEQRGRNMDLWYMMHVIGMYV